MCVCVYQWDLFRTRCELVESTSSKAIQCSHVGPPLSCVY